jgi:hypothetical protein
VRKRSITEILHRVIARARRPVEIMLVVYRDYDVPNAIVETSSVTKDPDTLVAWLNSIRAHGGGNNDGEAVERALEADHNARPPSDFNDSRESLAEMVTRCGGRNFVPYVSSWKLAVKLRRRTKNDRGGATFPGYNLRSRRKYA